MTGAAMDLRDELLINKPLVNNSGFRCQAHNAAVGGGAQSAHLTGEAADIACTSDADRYTLLRLFTTLGIRRLGIGSTLIHVDVSKTLPPCVVWVYKDK